MRLKVFFIFMLAAFTVSGQITVTSTHMATLGDTVLLGMDTTNGSSLNLGIAAGGQTWDFSMLIEHEPDGAILQAPSTAPLYTNFPDADFVVNDLDDSVHIFFRQTAAFLRIIGVVEYDSLGSPTVPAFIPLQDYMRYPSTFGDTFSSSFYIGQNVQYLGVDPDSSLPHPVIDSLRTKIYLETFSEIDAWGELQLPNGDYLAIRQYTWNRARFKGDWYGEGEWQPFSNSYILSNLDSISYDTNSEVNYRWWGNNPAANFWLAEVRYDIDADSVDSSVSFSNMAPLTPEGINSLGSDRIVVYPNPGSDLIRIEMAQPDDHSLILYDIQAKPVLQEFSPTGVFVLDVSALAQGTYLLMVNDAVGRPSALERIQVTR